MQIKKFFLLLTIISSVDAMQHPAKRVAACSGIDSAASTFCAYRHPLELPTGTELLVQAQGEAVQIPAYLRPYSGFLQTHCLLKGAEPMEITDFNSDMMEVIRDILNRVHEAITSGTSLKDILQEYLQNFDPSELESIYYAAQFFQLNSEILEVIMSTLLLHPETPAYFEDGAVGTCVLSQIADRTVLNSVAVRLSPIFAPRLADVIQHGYDFFSAIISGDNRYVVTASRDKRAKIYDLAERKVVGVIKHDDWVYSAAISSDNKYVVTASWDKTVKIYDIAEGKVVAEIQHGDRVYSAAISDDNKYVVTASWDKTVKIYDIAERKVVAEIQHGGGVLRAVISADNKYVVTVSSNGTVKIIRMSLTNEEVSTLNYDQVLFLIWLKKQDKGVVLDKKRLHEIYASLGASIKEYVQGAGYTVTKS